MGERGGCEGRLYGAVGGWVPAFARTMGEEGRARGGTGPHEGRLYGAVGRGPRIREDTRGGGWS